MVLVEEIYCLRRHLPRIKKAEVEELDEVIAAWKRGKEPGAKNSGQLENR